MLKIVLGVLSRKHAGEESSENMMWGERGEVLTFEP